MVSIHFTDPEFIWLLLSIPLLVASHFLVAKNLKTSAWTFANYEAIMRITGGKPTLRNATRLSRNVVLLAIKCAVMLFLVFSAAGTVFTVGGDGQGGDVVIAIDASSSMLAQDFSPNRFEAAKGAATTFVDALPAGTRMGLLSFAGTSVIEQEMTRDAFLMRDRIDTLQISHSGGTDLGEAIITATNLLRLQGREATGETGADAQAAPRGSVVLLTDGRSTVGTDVQDGIDYAKGQSTSVHTIGIATEEGGSFANIDIVSTIDEQSLQAIADSTGGSYHRAGSEEELRAAFDAIASDESVQIPVALRMPLLLLALALIFVEWGLAATKFRTLP